MALATKTLYVLSGLPFSGKTTVAKKLMEENDALLIERDRFLESINTEQVSRARIAEHAARITEPVSKLGKTKQENAWNDALTLEYVGRVREAIKHTDKPVVIVDGTHLQPLSRSFIRGLDGWRKIAIPVPTDAETCITRFLGAKTSGIRLTITPELIRNLAQVYEAPTESEGFDEIRTFG
ncbi:AAA family ATPase [Candidatus Uhrbacteria bacterium]|nr:AAA family ATPase [Candidatus Uhrbacteria bacterium]